jgi:hypothetical protein
MKLFQCQCCGQVLHFENTTCLRCGRAVGYLPDQDRMVAVEPDGSHWLVVPGQGALADPTHWRFCRNWELSACNWMVAVDPGAAVEDEYCAACRHNRIVPDLSDPDHHARWQRIEAAKRRLIYTLRNLGLPMPVMGDGHPEPLVFDFLADDPGSVQRVLTGHADGVVTISLTEADDSEREQMRERMGEAYRTLLGHFRHEVGHYYWDILVRDGGALQGFRAMFGDETADYAASLSRHYADGPPPGWAASYVSSYATMHPWEDWAETWAHYLHMVDLLETAASYQTSVTVPDPNAAQRHQVTDPFANPRPSFDDMVRQWVPLTLMLNSLNRSLGQNDAYPFALSSGAMGKLRFVHDLVHDLVQAPAG